MEEVTTMTIKELVAVLKKLPQDAKVYLSIDEEGNGFGTIHNDEGHMTSFSYEDEDNALIIYPWDERLDYDTICPKSSKVYEEEFKQQCKGEK